MTQIRARDWVRGMRVCVWHGWLLQGSGSNVYTAKLVEAMRAAGHDVVLLCQERRPERAGFVDAVGEVDGDGVDALEPMPGSSSGQGRVTLLRPRIGRLLPVFVHDNYEGFDEAKRFVDLTDGELDSYIDANAAALRAATAWHGSEVVLTGHAIPGGPIGLRAFGPGAYSTKVHGSDLVYAIDLQQRYARLARAGLEGAHSVIGLSRDVLERARAVAPGIARRLHPIPPGVDSRRWEPRPRQGALLEVSALLAGDADTQRGRLATAQQELREAITARDADAIEAIGTHYDPFVPDPQAAGRLQRLAGYHGPIVASLGKLIPEKGVETLVEALALSATDVHGLIVGFGSFREWIEAVRLVLAAGDVDGYRWLRSGDRLELGLSDEQVRASAGSARSIDMTGVLDHRYAPYAIAAADVLVVPSIEKEAFGMVAAEGAAAGALPLVARHSGLAEVAGALEAEVGREGLFSFASGPQGAARSIADGIRVLLSIPVEERASLRSAVSAFVAREWTWDSAARRVLDASRS
ncbi:MAG: glycosyltransferase [Actinomycetota bacterium]